MKTTGDRRLPESTPLLCRFPGHWEEEIGEFFSDDKKAD
jgi:hypothetical protein